MNHTISSYCPHHYQWLGDFDQASSCHQLGFSCHSSAACGVSDVSDPCCSSFFLWLSLFFIFFRLLSSESFPYFLVAHCWMLLTQYQAQIHFWQRLSAWLLCITITFSQHIFKDLVLRFRSTVWRRNKLPNLVFCSSTWHVWTWFFLNKGQKGGNLNFNYRNLGEQGHF